MRPATSIALVCSTFLLPAAAQEKFEVASIKPVNPNLPHMMGTNVFPGGRVTISCMPLKGLVVIAFNLSYWQIAGGDSWMEKDCYDVEALPAKGQAIGDFKYTLFSIGDDRLREMLQSLLADRFQLKFHRSSKTGDVYSLERSGRAFALRPADAAAQSFGSIGYVGGRWAIGATTMPQLAKFAADQVLHAPVSDRTGLSGVFDYRQTQPDSEPNYTDNSASFLQLLGEVGLKIKRSKGMIETFVIDQASRPTLN